MAIDVTCQACGKTVRAKDSMAGKKAKCPQCGEIMQIPDAGIVDAVDDYSDDDADDYSEDQYDDAYAEAEPPEYNPYASEGAALPSGDSRKPCPMCGEMIKSSAAKCRYCGEIFDPTLKKTAKSKRGGSSDADANMTTGDWVVAVLCSGIGCIVGVVWMIQGKPKGVKMLGVSFGFAVMWNVIRFLIEVAAQRGGGQGF